MSDGLRLVLMIAALPACIGVTTQLTTDTSAGSLLAFLLWLAVISKLAPKHYVSKNPD